MKYGSYYHLWIAASKDQLFFASSLDKAFFVSLLQDSLSPRIHFASHRNVPIDLLAYSLTDFGVNLLVWSTKESAVPSFGQNLLIDYTNYINQQRSWEILPFNSIFVHDRLSDIHEALSISREIHLLHDDWRYDPYSSIGFYLDDRRGDWVQAWRICRLFDSDPDWYQDYLMDDSDDPHMVGSSQLEFLET